jgi:hypothetical protein
LPPSPTPALDRWPSNGGRVFGCDERFRERKVFLDRKIQTLHVQNLEPPPQLKGKFRAR